MPQAKFTIMKNIKIYILMIITIIKRSNYLIAWIVDLVETINTIIQTTKIRTTKRLINSLLVLIFSKIIENKLNNLTVTAIDIIKILYKYEILIALVNTQIIISIIYLIEILNGVTIIINVEIITLILTIYVLVIGQLTVAAKIKKEVHTSHTFPEAASGVCWDKIRL